MNTAEAVSRAASAVRVQAVWPGPGESGDPPAVPGFIESTFPALVCAVADRCLTVRHCTPPGPVPHGDRTGVVLVSRYGDRATASAVARAVDDGTRMPSLLFFQSVPNAVAGRVAARWGLAGPIVCVSPVGDARAEGMDIADLLIADGDADEALVVLAEQGWTDGEPDRAEALLVTARAPGSRAGAEHPSKNPDVIAPPVTDRGGEPS
ncbi:beta-ketoacyl synthase N-terminal-like domain-containing protein [Streptomyces sp. NPDC047000]|uniref:beta-ketoacyl synthase N-terminal-like domain-containing protein n=1 Tax=Streptomyces sp. NPDC047000 TaxID=3155474 RepID=UPI00340BE336